MALTPVFVTQYEILRTSDYVLLTLSAPTGEMVDGKMAVQEVQRIALTYPRFIDLAKLMAQFAGNMVAGPSMAKGRMGRGAAPQPADEAEKEVAASPLDLVIRH